VTDSRDCAKTLPIVNEQVANWQQNSLMTRHGTTTTTSVTHPCHGNRLPPLPARAMCGIWSLKRKYFACLAPPLKVEDGFSMPGDYGMMNLLNSSLSS